MKTIQVGGWRSDLPCPTSNILADLRFRRVFLGLVSDRRCGQAALCKITRSSPRKVRGIFDSSKPLGGLVKRIFNEDIRMQKVARDAVLTSLEREWDIYLDQLVRLSPNERKEFLHKQGFDTMVDFLVHIVGWWQECMRIICVVQQEPNHKPAEVNVDEFNEKVIEENRSKGEEEVIELFTNVKSAIKEMISKLTESAIENETINAYLFWCITNHIEEHKII